MRTHATLAITACLVAALAGCADLPSAKSPEVVAGGVRFTLARDARAVAVAGDFNGWSTTQHPMVKDGDGRWSTTIPMEPGDHAFMYVVDGERWLTPPAAED